MKMKNMKGLCGDEDYPVESAKSREEYPWGTRLDLNGSVMKALGIKAGAVSVGDQMAVTAVAKVLSISADERGSSMCLQLVKLGVDGAKKKPDAEFDEGFEDDE